MPGPGEAVNPEIPEGQAELAKLVQAKNGDGSPAFTHDEINSYVAQKSQSLAKAGFSPKEISAYYGAAPPSDQELQAQVSRNLQAGGVTEAHGALQSLAAGWQVSDVGLATGGKPKLATPVHPSWTEALAAGTGQAVGDLPASVAGFFSGAAAGSSLGATAGAAVPGGGETGVPEAAGGVAGGLLGSGFGMNALPQAIRETYLDAYNRGNIHSSADFWHIMGVSTINTVKAGIVGAVTNVVAGPLGGKIVTATGSRILGAIGGDTAAAATGLATGSALDGHMPTKSDFIATSAMVLLQHGLVHVGTTVAGRFTPSSDTLRVQNNLEDVYRRTGITPDAAMQRANTDPVFARELLGQDVNGNPVTPHLDKAASPEPPLPAKTATPDKEAAALAGSPTHNPITGDYIPPEPKAGQIDGGDENAHQVTTGLIGQLEASPDSATSAKGAVGKYQVTLGTARQAGYGEGMNDAQLAAWLHDDHNNTTVATEIIGRLSGRFRGDVNATLVAYNAGPRVAGSYLTNGPGTALEAVKDPSTRSGYRYEQIPTARDESTLPTETQKYLARARLFSGAPGPKPEQLGQHPDDIQLTTLHTQSGQSYQVNARYAQNFQGFVHDLENAGYQVHSIGGYNDRSVAGGNTPSYHAQGAAIDINPGRNPVTEGPGAANTDLPGNIQQIASKWGLGWGGAWKSKKDPMHFSIAAEEGGSVAISRYGPRDTEGSAGGGGKPPGPVDGGEGGEGGGGPPAETGGGGGGGPPKPPKVIEEEPADEEGKKSFWQRASNEALEDEIMSKVGTEDVAKSLWQKTSDFSDKFVSDWVSELSPARNIDTELIKESEGGLDRNKDMLLEDQFRQTYASDMRTGVFGRWGILDPIEQKIVSTDSVLKATNEVQAAGGTMRGWTAYMLAGRAKNVEASGKESGFNKVAAETFFGKKSNTRMYADATKTFNNVMTGGLEYGRDSGLFSQDSVNRMVKANPIFMSFRRIMGGVDAPTGAGRNFRARNPLQRFEGSDKSITDPVAATLDNLRLVIKMADRNRAIGSVIGAVEAGKLPDLGFEKLEFRPTETLAPDAKAAFKVYGQDAGNEGAPDPNKTFQTLLAERSQKMNDPNTFMFYRNGQPELWRTSNPLLADLLRKSVTTGEADVVSKIFNKMAAVERAGIVSDPAFPTRVTLRHQFTAFVADPLHPPPIFTWISGIHDVLGTSGWYKDWVAKGGAGTALADMDVDWLQKDMDEVFQKNGIWDRVSNTVSHPLAFAQLVSEKIDAAARVGYYKRAVKDGLDPLKAATMSRKAYLDYAERSSAPISQGIAQKIPFWKPRILGAKQWIEAWGSRPWETAAYTAAAVTMPGIALYMANWLADQALPDGQKYSDLPRWERDNYMITPPIAGVRLKLQLVPYMGFVFKAVPERMFDAMAREDPHAFDGFARAVMSEYTPEVMPSSLPTLMQTPLEVATNQNFFTGKPLIPATVEKADGYMQYTNMTTEPAKAVARFLGKPGLNLMNVSPIQIEAFVNGWTGTIGPGILRAVNGSMTNYHPPGQVADLPVIQAFVVRNPGMGAQPIQDFYSDMDTLTAAHADWALALKRDNAAEINMASAGPWYGLNVLAGIKKTVAVQAAAINAINEDTSMRGSEKSQAVEQVYENMIQLCKRGTDIAHQLQEGGGHSPGDTK